MAEASPVDLGESAALIILGDDWQMPEPDLSEWAPREVVYREGTIAGSFAQAPNGTILHGTRSGVRKSLYDEWLGTSGYAASGIELGWSVTVGPGVITRHMGEAQWGWNAHGESQRKLAIEHAQTGYGGYNEDMPDEVIWTDAWWIKNYARKRWPSLPLYFPTHAELEVLGLVPRQGKTDIYAWGDERADTFRGRLAERLRRIGVAA